jgi:glutamyl-tRNA synthetase
MILGSDKTRLSKRHGATSVVAYREMGYLPEAMVNYIARLGWGCGDQEIFSRDELIAKFTLDAVNSNPAVFDVEKLNWLNGQYIRKALPERIADLAMPYLESSFARIRELEGSREGLEYIKKVVACLQDRVKVVPEISELTAYFFSDNVEYQKDAEEKYLKTDDAAALLTKLRETLAKVDPFVRQNIEAAFKSLAVGQNVKLGIIIHPARAALTGRTESPGIYDVVDILGKDVTLTRLNAAIKRYSR